MPRSCHRRHYAIWLAALTLGLALLALAAGQALAHYRGDLSNAGVTPRAVTAGGSVTLAVTYSNHSGAAPKSVVAWVGGTSVALTHTSSDFRDGVRYSGSYKPGVGRQSVVFVAANSKGGQIKLAAGYVTVTPAPKPTPRPIPRHTPRPTSHPTSTPTIPLRGTSTGPGDEGNPGPPTLPGPVASDQPTTGAQDDPLAGGSADPGASSEPVAAGQANDPSAGGSHASSGKVSGPSVDEVRAVVAPGVQPVPVDPLAQYRHPTLPGAVSELMPTIWTATTGGLAWAAFVIFGKRRRDGDDSQDPKLAAAAASGVEDGAANGLNSVDESIVDESMLPRWRRPSLQQVRRTDPLRAVEATAPALSFDAAGVRPASGYERRQIRYRLVRLLDSPDEVRAAEIGILDRDDEVQLLERYGVYWRVLCPDGRTGWVHRMTLSDAGGAAPASEAEPWEQPGLEAIGQTSAEAEGAEGVAADVDAQSAGFLEAYMRARGGLMETAEEAAVEAEPEPEATIEIEAAVEPEGVLQPLPEAEPEAAEAAVVPEMAVAPEPAVEPAAPARPGRRSSPKTHAKASPRSQPSRSAKHEPAVVEPEPVVESEAVEAEPAAVEPEVVEPEAVEAEAVEPVVEPEADAPSAGPFAFEAEQYELTQARLARVVGPAEPAIARAVDYLQRAGFSVLGPETSAHAPEKAFEAATDDTGSSEAPDQA